MEDEEIIELYFSRSEKAIEETRKNIMVRPTLEDPGYIAGDLNFDGKIDVTDLSEPSLALADGKEFTDEQQNAADVDKDGKVTLSDLARMRQFLSKIIEAFWEKNAFN